ncbi:MAG: hypothetical protein E4H17_01140 [Gemmatimonadales bacterium]|nr:MAG: hypothetical protein E4H17_01140 [Gemmatimonadales bacterium]
MNTRPGSTRFVPRLAALALLLSFILAPALRAQQVVQVPPIREASPVESPSDVDPVSTWVAQAKAGFQSNLGDSAGGENYRPYEKVGFIGRRLLRSLGRRDLLQAHAIKPVLDSLGLVTEMATDPASPAFALLMVRNPDRFTADAVGFLYWYKGDDLRIQGVVFKGGHHPRMRVWETGKREYPFEWGILDETRDRRPGFTMLRLSPGGTVWGIQQDEESFPLLGEPGEVAWVDLNQDGLPEFVSWTHGSTDSLFTECAGCPKLLTERTFIEGDDAFELQDQRLLPTPYATLVYFVRLLIDGKLVQAEKLVRDPAKVREAVAQGWDKRVVRKPWIVEYGESGQAWPRRLALRFEGPNGVKRYAVIFAMREGRWIIDNWLEPRAIERHYPPVTMPPATPAEPPAEANPPATPVRPPAKPPPAKTK